MSTLECREVFERLSEYIDGELPEDLSAILDKHIDDCAPCVEFVESLRKAKDLCRGFRPAERSRELDAEVRNQMREALGRCLGDVLVKGA